MLTSCAFAMSAVYPPVMPAEEPCAGVDHLAVDEDAPLLQIGWSPAEG